MLKDIGERVRQARRDKGISQAQLAQTLQISPHFLSNIEQGKQAMSVITLCGICEALDVSADWLLNDRTPESRRMTDEEVVRLLSDCTPAERTAIVKLLHNIKAVLRCAEE